MKIGILTFHWATNYGAVLQAYALQTVLTQMGHDVQIINYKPRQFDNNPWTFLRYRHFFHVPTFLANVNKEREMKKFRAEHLHTTARYLTQLDLKKECNNFEMLITGSDQVLNASFLQYGEAGPSTAYYLDFGSGEAMRVCYAVSFGVTEYPKHLIERVRSIVARMNAISVRESTGRNIFREMGREDTKIVPDPTLLLHNQDYINNLNINKSEQRSDSYFVYMLHGKLRNIEKKLPKNSIVSKSETIECWIGKINSSKAVITNSFHGAVFCILSHTPFLVVLPTKENVGMNDRFFTMLTKLGLENRITSEKYFNFSDITKPIEWDKVESLLKDYRDEGISFISQIINK